MQRHAARHEAARRRCTDQREYNSTISDSLMSAPNWSRSGSFLKTPSSLVASTVTQSGMPTDCASLTASVTRSCFLAFSRRLIVSPALTRYDAMSTVLPLTRIAWCDTSWRASARVEPKPEVKPEVKPETKPEPKPETRPDSKAEPAANGDRLDWGWPASGKIIAGFNETSSKGVDLAGKPGDLVLAAAGGRVVYAGTGLRGYGKLVIVKHDNSFLSAYAHNQALLVKEGQAVTKGQKIAELGDTDSDRPKLHFEIRRQGKPVDPGKFLPPR